MKNNKIDFFLLSFFVIHGLYIAQNNIIIQHSIYTHCVQRQHRFLKAMVENNPIEIPIVPSPRQLSFSVEWKYGEKPRDDCIEVTKSNKSVLNIRRWTTFTSFHFPQGAIVTGFRGRRDYKDGKCEGIMCCKWCPNQNMFISFIFTISNGYNGIFSEKDFDTMCLLDHSEFTLYNPDAIKNIKSELR